MEVSEREILQLRLELPNAEAVCQRSVNFKRLLRYALPLVRRQGFERPHVVQTIGKLYQHDADIVHHRQEHLPEIFGLVGFFA